MITSWKAGAQKIDSRCEHWYTLLENLDKKEEKGLKKHDWRGNTISTKVLSFCASEMMKYKTNETVIFYM